jgi:hypothetical protein
MRFIEVSKKTLILFRHQAPRFEFASGIREIHILHFTIEISEFKISNFSSLALKGAEISPRQIFA